MTDTNAWDMIADPPSELRSSSSRGSRAEFMESQVSQQMIKIDEAELQALGLAKEDIAEEAERQRADRKRRSKSPALESIRKASIHVLQKFGAISKKREQAVPLYKNPEIDLIPLETCCKRPKEFFQEPKPFSFRDLGKILLPSTESRQEKWYLPFFLVSCLYFFLFFSMLALSAFLV
nr:C. briggsae CBR-UNC-93 protein [Haemonchus contortus]CDJ91716.1 CRE-UNC-93 protein [Haemonchus contortus]